MAKEYFQDITPPGGSIAPRPTVSPRKPIEAPLPRSFSDDEPEPNDEGHDEDNEREIPIRTEEERPRGIRSIAPSRTRLDLEAHEGTPLSTAGGIPPRPRMRKGTRWWLWGIAAVLIIAVGLLFFVSTRPTTVTVVPRAHTAVFTSANQFTAYPAASAATGTLTYTVQTLDLQDSEVVPGTGASSTPSAPTKASGSITVYNAYSASSVRLIKDTRFQTPDGLIFRVPDAVVVPGKKGNAPGSVNVTVVADQAGDRYNIGPVSRFTVPGLKSNASMYANVYASSVSPMTGGSSGGSSGPQAQPDAQQSAIGDLQNKLQSEARQQAAAMSNATTTVLPDLIQISYSNQPNTPDANGNVRINESAQVQIPVFSAVDLGETVGADLTSSPGGEPMVLTPGSGFAAQLVGTTPVLGTDPITFTLSGQGTLVWQVDTSALASALAGRSSQAFQTVVTGFQGIETASARVEPFWSTTFPSDPSAIHVLLTQPQSSQ